MTAGEKVRLQREAYANALMEHRCNCSFVGRAFAERLAEVAYPYPQKTTPRIVVMSSGSSYRRVESQLEYSTLGSAYGLSMFTLTDIRLLANLVEHPLVFEEDQT